MISAAVLLLYAVTVMFCLPPLLSRLTARGTRARLGLATWLTAMASVLAALLAAVIFLVRPGIIHWSRWPAAVSGDAVETCSSVAQWVAVVQTCLFFLAAVVGAVAVLVCRYARLVCRARRRSREHAEVARMVGRRLPDADVLVLNSARPAVYCLPGRPPTIVVTDAALSVLEPAQLVAVLAHERAHLTGRHHLLLLLTRGLAALFPLAPLFGRGRARVAQLTEMCADDAATRRADRPTLVAALRAMGTAAAMPTAALGATGTGVADRVRRLADPSTRGDRTRVGLALTAVVLGLITGLVLVMALAVVLTGCRLVGI